MTRETEPKTESSSDPVRCQWCLGFDAYTRYHDEEWGVPSFDDRHQFEMLILEGAQAGLSWATVLKKREGYREAFDGFDPEKIARYDEKRIENLLLNPAIIRNRLKVAATVTNARAYLQVVESGKSFSDYLWQFTDGRPIVNRFTSLKELPAKTDLSDRVSKQLKKDGFKFIGSTIIYAHMQATGIVNDHVTGCFRHQQIIDSYPDMVPGM